ncbi:MAG: YCF48-related protein, partial [Candidatus Eiseniibacteriota bacterium]
MRPSVITHADRAAAGRCRVPLASITLAALALVATSMAACAGWDLQPGPTTADLYDVTASHGDIDIAWACGAGGTILFTSNGGATWTAQQSGTTEDLYGIAFQELAGGPVVAVGAGGMILHTTDLGTTWMARDSGTGAALRSISDFGFFVVGDGGTVLRSTDEGVTWSAMASGTTADLYAVSGSFSVYAVGAGGTLLSWHSTSGWFARDSGTTADLLGTPLFGATDYVVGDRGLVLRSTDHGISWEPQPTGTLAALRDVQLSVNNTSRLYAVGDGGTILKSVDHGVTWGTQESGTDEDLHGVFFYLDDHRGWAVGTGGTILRTNDGGGTPVLGVNDAEDAVEPAASGRAPAIGLAVYPNPFRSRATLAVDVDRPGHLTLELFDPAGRRVAGWTGRAERAGTRRIELDLARDLPAGVYFARLEAGGGGQVQTRSMTR